MLRVDEESGTRTLDHSQQVPLMAAGMPEQRSYNYPQPHYDPVRI